MSTASINERYVCGTQSFKYELKENSFTVTEKLYEVNTVVMGFDTGLTLKKIAYVCNPLLSRDLLYIATNSDYVCPALPNTDRAGLWKRLRYDLQRG